MVTSCLKKLYSFAKWWQNGSGVSITLKILTHCKYFTIFYFQSSTTSVQKPYCTKERTAGWGILLIHSLRKEPLCHIQTRARISQHIHTDWSGPSQLIHNVVITLPRRRSDVITSQWRQNNVITFCVCWVPCLYFIAADFVGNKGSIQTVWIHRLI